MEAKWVRVVGKLGARACPLDDEGGLLLAPRLSNQGPCGVWALGARRQPQQNAAEERRTPSLLHSTPLCGQGVEEASFDRRDASSPNPKVGEEASPQKAPSQGPPCSPGGKKHTQDSGQASPEGRVPLAATQGT